MWQKGHPYRWRTFIRSHLPLVFYKFGIAGKGQDCQKVGGQHSWYNIDGKTSGCYHCKVVREGKLWMEKL